MASELARLAEELGHSGLKIELTKSGRRFACSCACGWGAFRSDGSPTVTRATWQEAVKTLQHHLWKAIREERARQREMERSGVLLPGTVVPSR